MGFVTRLARQGPSHNNAARQRFETKPARQGFVTEGGGPRQHGVLTHPHLLPHILSVALLVLFQLLLCLFGCLVFVGTTLALLLSLDCCPPAHVKILGSEVLKEINYVLWLFDVAGPESRKLRYQGTVSSVAHNRRDYPD